MAVRPLPRGSRIDQSGGVVACPRDGGLLLIDVGAGRRIALDPFGQRVWTALTDRPTLALLLARLRDDDTPVERLAEDVTRLLARWRAWGVITWR